MEAETFVLKPKPDLLDPNFEGYKLNLEKIPIHSRPIHQGVLQAPESSSSYSYQQVRLHALHNHLVADPWSPSDNYFFSSDGSVQLIGLDSSPAAAAPLRCATVLQLPSCSRSCDQPAHPSLTLCSSGLALLSDGRGTLHLAETGDRPQARPWQIQFSDTVLDGCGFVLVHSVVDGDGLVHVLGSHVAEAASVSEWNAQGDEASFVNLLTWLTIIKGEGGWRVERLRQAATSGTVHYASLDTAGRALCVAAERPVRFIRDSERPVEPPAAAPPAPPGSAPLYVWTQTADDVTVQLSAGAAAGAGDAVRVVLEPRALTVAAGTQPLLQGALSAAIRLDESTWTNDDGRLEVVLAKVERGQMWAELIPGDSRGQQALDPELAAEIPQRLAHLTSDQQNPDADKHGGYNTTEMEDCDDFPEDSTALLRLDGDTHSVTHQTSLGGHQYILTARLAAAEQPAFCVRHDVDALLWQPSTRDGRWHCEHVGTLNAFGFVQASKQQRKFLTCAPDMSYAAICETSRHVFIYHQPAPISGDLRNRRTGRRVIQMCRQRVVSLEHDEPILGVAASGRALCVLTAGQVHLLVLG